MVKYLITDLLLSIPSGPAAFRRLFGRLPALEQKRVLFDILKQLSAMYLSSENDSSGKNSPPISAIAGLIQEVIKDDTPLRGHLQSWLATGSNAFTSDVGIRRSVLALLSKDREALVSVLESAVNNFGDQLYIKHAPMLQQEGKRP